MQALRCVRWLLLVLLHPICTTGLRCDEPLQLARPRLSLFSNQPYTRIHPIDHSSTQANGGGRAGGGSAAALRLAGRRGAPLDRAGVRAVHGQPGVPALAGAQQVPRGPGLRPLPRLPPLLAPPRIRPAPPVRDLLATETCDSVTSNKSRRRWKGAATTMHSPIGLLARSLAHRYPHCLAVLDLLGKEELRKVRYICVIRANVLLTLIRP